MMSPSAKMIMLMVVGAGIALIGHPVHGETDKGKLFVVLTTQDNPHHINYAKMSKAFIQQQAHEHRSSMSIDVVISTEEWPDLFGAWTFFPLLEEIAESYENDGVHWLLLIPEYTELNITNLIKVAAKHQHTEPIAIGRALKDDKHVITHHFAKPGLLYPDTSAGVLLNWAAVEMFTKLATPPMDFNIDARHELAVALKGEDVFLEDSEQFCAPELEKMDTCVTHYTIQSMICPASSAHKAITVDDIFILVKTGEVFHDSRVPLQKRLWTNGVKNLEYCSEKEDNSIPTVKIDAPNTERGHCAKFMAILKRAYSNEHISSKKWVIIVDDDTIMNVSRLVKLLTCYSTETPVVLGERYGFRSHTHGYDYITGGGGTVLNMAAIKSVIKSGHKCAADDNPDDMMMGMFSKRLNIPVLHSPLFHQAPPSTYAEKYLKSQKDYAISFHKYNEDIPEKVASEWLGLTVEKEGPLHIEL